RVPFALWYYVHFTYRARSIIAGYRQDTDSFYIDLGGSIHVQEDFLPPCPPTQPLSSANLPFTPSERYRPLTLFSPRHRATTTSVILSLPPAPPALYPSPPPTTSRSTVISRNVGYSGNLQTAADHACSFVSEQR
ncbi:hypothetical protein ALC62_04990, partial [Cyphomyrmex costatus]